VNDEILFYVVKGNWEYPFYYDKQRDDGDYLMGVVTAENKVIIPVNYSKIYNPHGSFYDMIEVEKDGLRGLYTVDGKDFIPAEFDGIYPSDVNNTLAQVRKGDAYGWVDWDGKVNFDVASNANKQLFQSPMESKSIMNWEFTYPGKISLLINPYDDIAESNGVIIYPSYIRDFGITSIANAYVMLETSTYSMGMTDTTIKFEKVESLSDKLFSLVSFFMETGADARGYHTAQNDLLVVDEQLNKLNHLEKLTEEYGAQNPCGEVSPVYQAIEDNIYESADGYGNYKYYKITTNGDIEALETVRKYNFTKFAKIDESYFNHCRYESLEYSNWEDQLPNVVIISGLSSEELDIMRNEIFAEYGLIFKSEKWKNYFEAQPWYEGQYDNVDQYLSETDKFNIKFILDYQKEHKEQVEQRDSIQFMWAG
jgi:YARHG domain